MTFVKIPMSDEMPIGARVYAAPMVRIEKEVIDRQTGDWKTEVYVPGERTNSLKLQYEQALAHLMWMADRVDQRSPKLQFRFLTEWEEMEWPDAQQIVADGAVVVASVVSTPGGSASTASSIPTGSGGCSKPDTDPSSCGEKGGRTAMVMEGNAADGHRWYGPFEAETMGEARELAAEWANHEFPHEPEVWWVVEVMAP